MKKLIFIEGVSGVGKTTMVRKLCDKLRSMGFSADCYLEFDFTNPIDFYCTAYFTQDEYTTLFAEYPEFSDDIKNNTIIVEDVRLIRYYNGDTPLFFEPLLNVFRSHEFCWKPIDLVSLSEYTCVYKSVWEQFAQSEKVQIDYLIFDGSLFHHPINDMIRNYNVSCDQAAYHVNTLIEAVDSLNPRIVYLSSDNVAERLHDARISRKETPPSAEQIQFWEERKQVDLGVMKQLAIPFDIYNISDGNWDSVTNEITGHILETDEERQARIYPIILSEYNPAWPEWFAEEKTNLERLISKKNIARISHYGSTSVPGLTAKPTVDILFEIAETACIEELIALMPKEYICLRKEGNSLSEHDLVMFLKGYTDTGFADKVFHIHVRNPGDWDELYFRDYLIAHPKTAAEYAELKRSLFKEYEYNRDGYTAAKGTFIKEITDKAKEQNRGNKS